MAHVQPGDIIFFKPAGPISWLNVLGQSMLTRRLSQWSHVALCVSGPLVIHATPRHKDLPSIRRMWLAMTDAPAAGARSNRGAGEGGAHLELLEREFVSNATFTVMRLQSAASDASFEPRLQEATTYWLAQPYSFLPIYLAQLRGRAAILPGRSFCSFLVQQVYARMGLERFGILGKVADRTLMPGELFNLLSGDREHWQLVASASLAGSDAEEHLTVQIRRQSANPTEALQHYLTIHLATMATIRTVAEARILSIQRVQTLNRLFTEMNKIRVLVASAVAQLPAGDAAKVIARVQSEIEPLVDRAAAAIGTHSAPKGDLLFMNYRPLLSIVMAPKGSGTVDLRDHWISNQGGATLRAPDEDFVERYIASQNAIVSAIELHRLGALRQLDARWELPSDIPTTLAAIQDDISRLDECSLSDWQVERANVRALLVRMKALIAAAT